MKTSLTAIALLSSALVCFAQNEAAKPAPASNAPVTAQSSAKDISETDAMKLENLTLKAQLEQKEIDAANARIAALQDQYVLITKRVCKDLVGVEIEQCLVNRRPDGRGGWYVDRRPAAPEVKK